MSCCINFERCPEIRFDCGVSPVGVKCKRLPEEPSLWDIVSLSIKQSSDKFYKLSMIPANDMDIVVIQISEKL